MNVVREINKINEQELQLGVKGSWHDEYKDSAYVFVGGLSYDLTEGDVITIMSQYGEVIDINMPRDKETGKPKGFSFLMYEDQRSTVLAVDNMNGAQVLGRTIRVDHCKKYEQRGTKNAEGDYVAPEEPTYNAMPPTLEGSSDESSSDSEADELDEEDPMAAYLRQEKKTKKITDGKKRKRNGEGEGESKEERRARKEDKRRRKEERDRKRKERESRKGDKRQQAEASGSRARAPESPRPRQRVDSGEPHDGPRVRASDAGRSDRRRDDHLREKGREGSPRRSRDPVDDRRERSRDHDRRRDRPRDHPAREDGRDRDRRRDYDSRDDRHARRSPDDRNGRNSREDYDDDRRYRR